MTRLGGPLLSFWDRNSLLHGKFGSFRPPQGITRHQRKRLAFALCGIDHEVKVCPNRDRQH